MVAVAAYDRMRETHVHDDRCCAAVGGAAGNEAELSKTYPSAAISKKLSAIALPISPLARLCRSPTMLRLPKPAAIAIQATLGSALSAPWAVPALAEPANTATQSQTTPLLHEGDLVQLRSGGPEMTVKSVQGKWVIATWWNEGYGGFQSSGFPLAMVDGPITLPPVDVSPPTSPTER